MAVRYFRLAEQYVVERIPRVLLNVAIQAVCSGAPKERAPKEGEP
jgi:hypothetical protein